MRHEPFWAKAVVAVLALVVVVLSAYATLGTEEGRDFYCKSKMNTDPFLCDGHFGTFE